MRYHESGGVGLGIGCLNHDEAEAMLQEMKELKKKIRMIIGGTTYRLLFSKYESFGEWVHRIQMKAIGRPLRLS